MSYLHWDNKEVDTKDAYAVTELFNSGYVLIRKSANKMQQTRSVRIDLEKYSPSSENKRILRKSEEVTFVPRELPLSDYHWSIGKLGKDFYDSKFGKGTFSANKIKEILATPESSFNRLFEYQVYEGEFEDSKHHSPVDDREENHHEHSKGEKHITVGYAICYENDELVHYSYPFYSMDYPNKSLGMSMMTKAIEYAKENGKKYIYLGSAQRPTDTYKLQFKGMEWFDGESWSEDLDELKEVLAKL